MPMETRTSKVFFSNILLSKNSRKFPRTAAVGKKKEKKVRCFIFYPPNGCRRRKLFFVVTNCQHADRNHLVRRSTLDLDIDSAHGQPSRYLARPTNSDDGLEDIRWAHGLGGESLVAASYGILPNLKKSLFFYIRDGRRSFVFWFVQSSGQLFFYLNNMPG